MSAPTRRTVVNAALWTAPAVTIVAVAPAFAASSAPPPVCTVTGIKRPGRPRGFAYRARVECAGGNVTGVQIDGILAILRPDGYWTITNRPNSRGPLHVLITTDTGQWSSTVLFHPETTA